ncbi:MAG TPA: SMC family ATPase [Streptosporangiaceae bacterium]|nr:SMC family ATPase [Streptosporangiaceae bacterium]
MRLNRLELRAFGPYASAQQIDFSRLAASGLFLLEGPTGAGKSTILDAITFALYGGLAGEEAGADRLRSHFAAPDAEPSVTLDFSVRGVRYLLTRVPEHQRPKRRGDGVTTEHAQVHLQRREGARWISLTSNKAEAGELVSELIGLSRAQFTQVMLLPQGEFAHFLRAADDERRVLLSRLFGTQLYDRVTAWLDQQRAAAQVRRRQAGAAIDAAVSAAAEAGGLDGAARTELLALPPAERATQLKELGADLAAHRAVTADGLEVATARSAVLATACEQARQQSAAMTGLTTAAARLAGHESTRGEHEDRAARLAAARRAEPVRPLLAALSDADRAVQEAAGVLGQPGAELAGADAGGADADGADTARAGAAEAAGRAQAAEQEAAALRHLAGAEAGLPGRLAALASLRQAAADSDGLRSELEAAQQELPGRLAALEEQLTAARLAAAGLGAAREQQAAVSQRAVAAARLAGLEEQLAAQDTALRGAIDTHQALVDEHQRLMDTRLAGMAAELASQLADGVPCPVCGSAAHPAPAQARSGLVSAADVADVAARRDATSAERTRLAGDRETLAGQVASSAALAGGGTAAGLAAEAAALAGLAAVAEQAAADADRLAAELAGVRAEQERVSAELRDAAAAAAASQAQAAAAGEEVTALQRELATAAQGHPSVTARQAALREAADADHRLGAALDTLATARGEQARAQARAGQEAQARGFDHPDQASAALLSPARQDELAAQVAAWTETLAGLRTALAAGEFAGLDPARAGQVHAAARAAAGALAEAGAAEREARVAHQGWATKADRLEQRLAELAAAQREADRLDEETAPVISLAGLAKGMEGQRRVALTTYVLRHWFGQVVAAANVRLAAMSAGRYELRRTDEAASRRERTGLTLAVIDRHTGAERSPRSLSGGETFYTSLALALGLADVVKAEAGGVDLDTLFIDEGFGTLDADTLDQVMTVIDDLRERGRAVGIVSHVTDLKDRIAERLEVRRLADGSSAVRVIA